MRFRRRSGRHPGKMKQKMMEAKIITQEKTASFGTNFGIIWWCASMDGWMIRMQRKRERGNGSLSRCKLGPLGKMGGRRAVSGCSF